MNSKGAYQLKARNIESVKARLTLLLDGLKYPDKINAKISASLSTQGSFAALCLENKNITPLSLNTMKALANELYRDISNHNGCGYKYFDYYRIQLYEAVNHLKSNRNLSSKISHLTLSRDISSAKSSSLEINNIRLLDAYMHLLKSISLLISECNADILFITKFTRIISDHNELYKDILSHNKSNNISTKSTSLSIVR